MLVAKIAGFGWTITNQKIMNIEDKLAISEAAASYFLSLDTFENVESIIGHMVPEAVWECFNAGTPEPVIRLESVEQLRVIMAIQGASERALRLRHHITGIVFQKLEEDFAQCLIKVLVTSQPDTTKAPSVRNNAIVTGSWKKTDGGWKILKWRIDRDSSI